MKIPAFPKYLFRPQSRKTFLSYFLSITTLCGLAVIVSVVLSYRTFEQEIVTQLHQQNNVELERVGSIFTATHAAVIPSALQLISNPTINRLLYSRTISRPDIARGNALLDQAKLSNPNLHSIVVYSYARETFYSTEHGPIAASDFENTSLRRILSGYGEESMYRFIPRMLNGEPVLTVLVGAPAGGSGVLRGALVTNVSERSLRTLLDGRTGRTGAELFVSDETGRILSHPDTEQFGTTLGETPVWETIRAHSTNGSGVTNHDGTFLLDINGIETAVSYLIHQPMNWHIVLTTPTETLFGTVRTTRNQIIFFTGVSVLAATILALLLAMWIYGPFERLRNAASELALDFLETPPQAVQAIEIRYLEDVLRQIHTQAVSRAQETQELRKRDVLKSLLLGSVNTDATDLETNEFALQPDAGTLRVIVCRIDDRAGLIQKNGDEAVSAQRNLITGCARAFAMSSAVVEIGEDHIVLLVPSGTEDTREIEDHLTVLNRDIREASQKSVSIGVSEPVTHVRDLHHAYVNALQASDTRFRLGPGRIIFAEAVRLDDESSEQAIPEAKVRHFIQTARRGRTDLALEVFFEIARQWSACSYSEFTFAAQYILYELERSFRTLGPGAHTHANRLHQLRTNPVWLESIDDLAHEAGRSVQLLANISANEAGQKTRELIAHTHDLICREFADSNLSAKVLASRLGVSTNYLRQCFREVEGQSISELITTHRLKQVAQSLGNTSESVRSIQEQSGFSNYNYFFRKFKEAYGVTPMEYRRNSLESFSE